MRWWEKLSVAVMIISFVALIILLSLYISIAASTP